MLKADKKQLKCGANLVKHALTSNGKCDDEIVKIIEIARGAFNSILKTITARHISMKT